MSCNQCILDVSSVTTWDQGMISDLPTKSSELATKPNRLCFSRGTKSDGTEVSFPCTDDPSDPAGSTPKNFVGDATYEVCMDVPCPAGQSDCNENGLCGDDGWCVPDDGSDDA